MYIIYYRSKIVQSAVVWEVLLMKDAEEVALIFYSYQLNVTKFVTNKLKVESFICLLVEFQVKIV